MTQPKIKLYRGSQAASLPTEIIDGAIYILAKDSVSGEMYTDIHDKRIKISSQEKIYTRTTEEWNNTPTLKSEKGVMYVYSDAFTYTDENNNLKSAPGIKIGDGNAYIIDLPFTSNISPEKIAFWDNKVNCYLETELSSTGNKENLIFTRIL